MNTKNNLLSLSVAMLLTLSLLCTPPAHAQLNLSFDDAAITTTGGDTVTFSGTVSNPGTDTVFLNGDSIQGLDSSFTTDDSPFLFDAPLSLDGGQSYSGDLFTVTLPDPNPPAFYNGTFSILGGADNSVTDTVASAPFTVTVPDPTVVTPEASSFLTLGILLVGLGSLIWRRKRIATFSEASTEQPD